MTRIFLSAEWRYLVMLNYEIDPALLQPFVPQGTVLDDWHGRIYASIVGFLFQNTRLLGVSIPGHTNFEEVNLRFYVRRRGPEGWRRGVVFIKELVPRRAIAAMARLIYNENYQALPMRHRLELQPTDSNDALNTAVSLAYEWKFQGRWQGIQATAKGPSSAIEEGSEAEFITEHYWGYAAQRDGGTVEYQVEHPRWRVWQVGDFRGSNRGDFRGSNRGDFRGSNRGDYQFDCDVADLYGPQFVAPLSQTPTSAFIADGSAIIVRQGRRIEDS
jgi:uncharacterized protein